MKLQEAIHILTLHQAWRLGTDMPMAEPKQLSEAIHVILNHHMVDETQTTSSQTEISDEEIEKAMWEHFSDEYADMWSERLAFRLACKWYREQLKQRQ